MAWLAALVSLSQLAGAELRSGTIELGQDELVELGRFAFLPANGFLNVKVKTDRKPSEALQLNMTLLMFMEKDLTYLRRSGIDHCEWWKHSRDRAVVVLKGVVGVPFIKEGITWLNNVTQFCGVRDMPLGGIFNAKHAEKNCPIRCEDVGGEWTRNWDSGHCQCSFSCAFSSQMPQRTHVRSFTLDRCGRNSRSEEKFECRGCKRRSFQFEMQFQQGQASGRELSADRIFLWPVFVLVLLCAIILVVFGFDSVENNRDDMLAAGSSVKSGCVAHCCEVLSDTQVLLPLLQVLVCGVGLIWLLVVGVRGEDFLPLSLLLCTACTCAASVPILRLLFLLPGASLQGVVHKLRSRLPLGKPVLAACGASAPVLKGILLFGSLGSLLVTQTGPILFICWSPGIFTVLCQALCVGSVCWAGFTCTQGKPARAQCLGSLGVHQLGISSSILWWELLPTGKKPMDLTFPKSSPCDYDVFDVPIALFDGQRLDHMTYQLKHKFYRTRPMFWMSENMFNVCETMINAKGKINRLRYGYERKYPSTGCVAFVLATQICNSISLYGFGPDSARDAEHPIVEGNKSEHKGQPATYSLFQEKAFLAFHDFATEHAIISGFARAIDPDGVIEQWAGRLVDNATFRALWQTGVPLIRFALACAKIRYPGPGITRSHVDLGPCKSEPVLVTTEEHCVEMATVSLGGNAGWAAIGANKACDVYASCAACEDVDGKPLPSCNIAGATMTRIKAIDVKEPMLTCEKVKPVPGLLAPMLEARDYGRLPSKPDVNDGLDGFKKAKVAGPEMVMRQGKRWDTCAIVGSGSELAGQKAGPAIDAHEQVWRLNTQAVHEMYEDLGRKTTLMVSNHHAWKRICYPSDPR